MLETSRLWWIAPAVLITACASPEREAVMAPAAPPQPVSPAPVRDDASVAEEAKALRAQAEPDVHRARARRALWLKAWEDLLAARKAVAAKEYPAAIRLAKRASELAQ